MHKKTVSHRPVSRQEESARFGIRHLEDLSEDEKAKLLTLAQKKLHPKVPQIKKARGKKQKKYKPQLINGSHAYGDRNRLLQMMGFASYADYLKSDLWKWIRRHVFAKSHVCHICRIRATVAHHSSYHEASLKGKDISGIYPLCHSCHEKIEFRDQDHHKLTPKEATKKMKVLRKQHRNTIPLSIPKANVKQQALYVHIGNFWVAVA